MGRPSTLWLAVLLAAGAFFVSVSFSSLTTWPSFWYDEAVAVEIAHNAATYGVFNILVAPDQFSPYGIMIGANGYPLSAPLAALFKIVGFSLPLVRIYMLLWCLATVAAVFLFIKKFFTLETAIFSALLLLSFSSFFANGRTLTGEIPGFFFLITGLWYLLDKKFLWAGVLLGLAAAAKPSLYLLLCIPAAVDVLFFTENKIKNLFVVAGGYALPITVWLCLTVSWPLPAGFAQGLIEYYKNPFGSASMISNMFTNVVHAPFNSTLIYFVLLGVVVVSGWYFVPKEASTQKRMYLFFAIVSVLSLFYFLRSPGWLRYLVPLELCVLTMLPAALLTLQQKYNVRHVYVGVCVAVLVLFQSYVWLFHSNIFSTSVPQQVAAYLNSQRGSIGIINAPAIAALVPQSRVYQYISMAGIPPHGVNALALPHSELPAFIVINEDTSYIVKGYEPVLTNKYQQSSLRVGGYLIYERNK